MYAIEARGLHKTFKKTKAVDGVDLLIEEGDVVGLLGPNGAGKTTTMMMLLGITEPDSGTIKLLDHILPKGRSRAAEDINFTASYVGLPYRMKVREVLTIFADLYRVPRARVFESAERFRITDLLERYTNHLSSGQRTLVSLAKSLLNRPRLLLLDEPTASLDPEVAELVRAVLREINADHGSTILVTSHNMADIERMCRRVIFISGGKVVADGTAAEVASRYGADDLEGTFISIASESRL